MVQKENKEKHDNYNSGSINRIIFMIVASAILIQGAIWLADSIYLFRSDIEDVNQIQTEYIKAQLKERVASVIDYSDYRSQETESVLRDELSSRTYEAYALMNSIYENNKADKSKEEITEIIKDALREIRFNDGRGYFFVDTLEGDVILYPVYKENEGKNILDLQDEKGNFVMREEISLVRREGEGYIEGYWKNPNAGDDKTYKKITFVKAFEPYGWYLGCGDYLDEITKEIQSEVLAYVDSIKYGEDDGQYVFLHDYKGLELANGVYPEYVGYNHFELEDIKGSKVYQEQINICLEDDGGYLTHYWPRADGFGSYKKLTYVAPLPEWEWIIGTGVDVTYLDEMIQNKEKELINFIWFRLAIIILVLGVLIAISMLNVNRFMTKMKKNFSVFRDAMISAKMRLSKIDVESLDYVDFSELAEVTNSMTDRINHLLHYDELTGIYNRRYIKEVLDNIFVEFPQETGIIVMDIDKFKRVNDRFGHDVGDDTLVIIARLIEKALPEGAYVGRFGGEEFIVVVPEVTLEETCLVGESIRESIANYHIEAINGHITISGGVAHSGNLTRESLFKHADEKLYLAKELGRNRIEC